MRTEILRTRIERWSRTTSFLPLLLCRITLGWEFIISGWHKLHDQAGTAQFFSQLGIPLPGFNAVLVTGSELVFDALLLVGLLSRLATIPLTITMIVALLTANICMLLVVLVFGPGGVSLDALVGRGHDVTRPGHRHALAT